MPFEIKKVFYLAAIIILSNLCIYSIQKNNNNESNIKYLKKISNLDGSAKPGKQYLFIIAIDKYKYRLSLDLYSKNAEELKKALYENYYIDEIKELSDLEATAENIFYFFKELKKSLKQNDSLIIYYGGHGFTDDKTNEAWWIPSDGGINEIQKENWISMKDIKNYLSELPSEHVLLINDSCFSENYLKLKNKGNDNLNEEYYRKSFINRSIQVISSGIKETRDIKSNFFSRLIDYLKSYKKPYLTMQNFYDTLPVNENEKPVFGNLLNSGSNENGNFILFLRENDPAAFNELENEAKPVQNEKQNILKSLFKFNLESRTEFDSGFKGGNTSQVTDSQPDQGGDVFLVSGIKTYLKITPLSFYNIGLWLMDTFDVKLFDTSSSDSTVQSRNRFYSGLDNIFILNKAMNVGLNFEFRLTNNINSVVTEDRISPVLFLCGNYKSGLNFKLNTLFEFYLYPGLYKFPYDPNINETTNKGVDENKLFQRFCIEVDSFNLGFEILHFFIPQNNDLKFSFVYNMYLLATIYIPGFQSQYNYYNGEEVMGANPSNASFVLNKMNYMKNFFGIDFSYKGIEPFIGYYNIISQRQGSWNAAYDSVQDFNLNGVYTDYRHGLKGGVTVKINWFEFGVSYSGIVLTASSDPLMQGDTTAKVAYPTIFTWENYITSYVLFRL